MKLPSTLERRLLERVNRAVERLCRGGRRVNLMEVCGTHTMVISSSGIRRAVDSRLRLLSGPGCPVCVTAQAEVDAAIELGRVAGVTVVTFGDMMRVPGSRGTLDELRARGADVRVVYSPLDCLAMARAEPERQFVFLGVGFETTAPTVAATVEAADRGRVANFTVWPMFKTIPPALRVIAAGQGAGATRIDGLLLPGHVSAVIGAGPYRFLAREYGLPCVVAGFEPLDVLQSVAMLLGQVGGRPQVEVQYGRSVRTSGNPTARAVMNRVFRPVDAEWRGVGQVPGSGLAFRARFRRFDASVRFKVRVPKPKHTACRCGDVMLGAITPPECRLFGRACTPERAVGPCMVSSEGACAAYYKYDRQVDGESKSKV